MVAAHDLSGFCTMVNVGASYRDGVSLDKFPGVEEPPFVPMPHGEEVLS